MESILQVAPTHVARLSRKDDRAIFLLSCRSRLHCQASRPQLHHPDEDAIHEVADMPSTSPSTPESRPLSRQASTSSRTSRAHRSSKYYNAGGDVLRACSCRCCSAFVSRPRPAGGVSGRADSERMFQQAVGSSRQRQTALICALLPFNECAHSDMVDISAIVRVRYASAMPIVSTAVQINSFGACCQPIGCHTWIKPGWKALDPLCGRSIYFSHRARVESRGVVIGRKTRNAASANAMQPTVRCETVSVGTTCLVRQSDTRWFSQIARTQKFAWGQPRHREVWNGFGDV
jgi:hypothetical protein